MPTDYTAIQAAWNTATGPGGYGGLTACTTCHHRTVVQQGGVDVVACTSPDVGTRATVHPVGPARSNAGPCGPEATFWLHPSDAAAQAQQPRPKTTAVQRIAAWSAVLAEQRRLAA